MKIIWLTTSSMSLEPIIGSLDNFLMKNGPESGAQIGHATFDKGSVDTKGSVDPVFQNIRKMVIEDKPDLILYAGPANGPKMPDPQDIRALKETCPIVNIICDGGDKGSHPGIEAFQKAESFTLHVNIDGIKDWPHTEKDITTLCPIDMRYYQQEFKKDVKLGFHGGNGHKDRRDVIEKLGPHLLTGERNEKYGSYADFANFMKRCQYVLNHAANGSNTGMHCKARVIETALAMGCLLEQKGSPIAQYFTPGEDYIEWETPEEIVSIVEKTPESAREVIANSLHAKVIKQYSSLLFWGKVFKSVQEITKSGG